MQSNLANIKFEKHKEKTQKIVFCVKDFMLIFSNLADYELKFYWISGLLDFFCSVMNSCSRNKLKSVYAKYNLHKIIPKYDIKNKDILKYPSFKSRQSLLLYYHLDKEFIPFLERQRRKIAAECKEQIKKSIKQISKCVSSSDLPAFNYSAKVVKMFCDNLELSNQERIVYYMYIINKIYKDIDTGIIANNKTLGNNIELFNRELDFLRTMNNLRLPLMNDLNSNSDNNEPGNIFPINHNSNNPPPVEPVFYHILNKDRIKLNGSYEQCKKLILLLQEYKYLDDMRETDPECKFYLSLFVNKDNIPFGNEPVQMVRFNGDNNELAYLIKHFSFGKEPLISDRRCWKRTEGVFLDKYGEKFKNGSLRNSAYNNPMPDNHKILDRIINEVKSLKEIKH